MAVQHVNEAEFRALRDQGGVILVDFWATWCPPCKMIAPVIEALGQQYEGRVSVVKVDVDENPGLAAEFGVQSIPNVCILKDGQLVDRIVGASPLSDYAAALDAVL